MNDENRRELAQRLVLLRLKVKAISTHRDLSAEIQELVSDGSVPCELMDQAYSPERVKKDRELQHERAASLAGLRAELEEVEYRLSSPWRRLVLRLGRRRHNASKM